jgi:hypothetical protein
MTSPCRSHHRRRSAPSRGSSAVISWSMRGRYPCRARAAGCVLPSVAETKTRTGRFHAGLDCGAAGGAQFVKLRIGALFVSGDACVADQAACAGVRALAASRQLCPPLSAQYNSTRWQRWPGGTRRCIPSVGQGACLPLRPGRASIHAFFYRDLRVQNHA